MVEKLIGIDVGYGFVKATDGQEGFLFPSVVGDGNSDSLLRIGLQAPEATEDLRLTIDGKLYYAGNLAIRHSRMAYRSLSATREEGNDILVLFLSALSLFCHQPLNTFSVVTGLPPGRMHLANELMQQLKGQHRVIRHRASGPEELSIRIERMLVVPQPLGTYWSQALDPKGKLREDAAMLEGRVGIVDVGFRTSDLVSVEGGEYIPEQSRTIPMGLATAYGGIAARLLSEYGIEREHHALDEAVIRGEISISGRRVDITGFRDPAFSQLATKLFVEIRSTWQLAEYDRLILTGGGGRALERYLMSHFTQGMVPVDPITANSRGYLAWAHRIWTPGQAPWSEPTPVSV